MTNRAIYVNATVSLITEECCECGMTFGMTSDFQRRRRDDKKSFHCPSGHPQHYTGTTNEQKLKDAAARETHLKDQLLAAAQEAETARVALVRDRHRFANGVCPCCNRYFSKVHQHMTTQHPDYDVTKIDTPRSAVKFICSCGFNARSFHGLRVHQGRMRGPDWASKPKGRTWGGAHLTVTS